MNKLNVYLSSPYLEFRETRERFLKEIRSRSYLYEITAMEDYRAEDRNVLDKCIEDVKKCNIYVCIIGETYGTPAKSGEDKAYSFTYWEYLTACERKDKGEDIERLVLIKKLAAKENLDPRLQQWRDEIGNSQIQTLFFNDLEEIPQKILESLDNFTLKRLRASLQKKDLMKEKIYLCDRTEQNMEFATSIDDDPIQFFILKGHDKDLPHYFIKRQEIEFENSSCQWTNINVKPAIPNDTKDFEKVEMYMKAEIRSKLKWHKFKLPKDVTVDGLIDYMNENRIDYLSISWSIESIYWKNDSLKEFIVSFYNKYNQINANLSTDKRIIFFGILCYTENPDISEEEFNNKISKIEWEHNLPKFKKINKGDIKDWLVESGIEEMDSRNEELISLYLKELMAKELYFSEVENGLRQIITLYHQDIT